MTWVLGWMYLRKADRVFDPLAERVVADAEGREAAPAEAAHERPQPVPAPSGRVAPQ
jgi:hypothetical protein